MKQKIFLGILAAILIFFGVGIFNEYWINHTYYIAMLNSGDNWKIFLGVIVSSLIPIYYLYSSKKFLLKRFFILLFVGLLLFSIINIAIKDTILGGGLVILIINTLIIFALGAYFVLGTLSLGSRVSNQTIKFKENRRQEMFLNFGIGLVVMLLFIYLFASLRILYPIFTWMFFVGWGFLIYYQKKTLIHYKGIIVENIQEFKDYELRKNRWKWIGLILIIISIIYYFYGFNLSFIPYSTAWDANHAYMYEPKVLAENFGVLWGNIWAASQAPQLWHAFITFWFSLIQPIKGGFWLSPDNIAVSMNFLSGIFVLIFSLGTIREIINFFDKKIKEFKEGELIKNISFYSGWFWILLWLTSGMGAFLVFVDNKTDLGVMAMTILAILSGIIFINYIKDHKEKKLAIGSEFSKYIIVSGLFFTIASMSKPTAFLDISIFGLLLLGFWFNWIMAAGAGISVMGFMGVLQIGNAFDFISIGAGKILVLIGIVIFILGMIPFLINGFKNKKNNIQNFILWFLTFVISLLILKGPTLLYKQVLNGDFGISNFAKGLLMGYVENKTEIQDFDSSKKLLAQSDNLQEIAQQNQIDSQFIDDILPIYNIPIDQCRLENFNQQDLEKNLREAVASNEDVGRYVGYGRKEIKKTKGLNLSYHILRIFYPKNNKCYGLNKDAVILCKNKNFIDTFDVKYLEQIINKVKKDGEAYEILNGALKEFENKGYDESSNYDPNEFRGYIVGLRQYYQNNSIRTEFNKINIPYRYLVPFNVVHNRSLQNLSSYYTDIGFVWMIMFIFIIFALIYGFINNHKNLISLSAIVIVGWGIRWLIGGGIVWYGIGLIMWSTMLFAIFIKDLFENNNNEGDKNLLWVVILLVGLWGATQFLLNFIRISSQGAGGPFLRYKMNVGKSFEFNEMLQGQETEKYGYGREDVFNLQFPHYNKFINLVENRDNQDGVLIAGTYIQYFLKNQNNIRGDGSLSWLWEITSDNNLCKSYHRLKNENIKYFVIDPNIGTIVMGEGNESLFHRFFAKVSPVDGTIQDHGALSSMTKMVQNGYMNFIYSNNIGAKYAYILSDENIKQYFGEMSDDQIIFLRTKMAVARFFPDANQLIQFIAEIFSQRIVNGQAIGDIANILGKDVDLDVNKLLGIVQLYIEKQGLVDEVQKQIAELGKDERNVLAQYLYLYNLLRSGNQQQYSEVLNNLLGQSLGGGSQLIVFELVD